MRVRLYVALIRCLARVCVRFISSFSRPSVCTGFSTYQTRNVAFFRMCDIVRLLFSVFTTAVFTRTAPRHCGRPPAVVHEKG